MARHLVNEHELVSAAQAGDGEAFGALVNSCYEPTFRVAIRIVGNREDAEDVMQEAMLKAYCGIAGFQGSSRFYTWMVRITINEALMRIRRRRSMKEVEFDEPPNGERGQFQREIEDWSHYPESEYARRELQRVIDEALSGLSPRLCMAFRLRNIEELSVKETAARLGLSAHGVKSRVSRARSRLRERLRRIFQSGCRCNCKSLE